MGINLELEPRVEPKPKRMFLRSLSAVAALSLAACGGGGEEGKAAATNRDTATTQGEDSDPSSTSSSSTTESTLPPTTLLETTTTATPTTTERPATTQAPTTRPPATQPPATQPPTTTPPQSPPPSRQPLQGPANFRINDRAHSCQDVPPPPGGAQGQYGRLCLMNTVAYQQEVRPEGSGQRITTVFVNCGPGETPTPRTNGDGTQGFWLCENTWAQGIASPYNHIGDVSSAVQVRANERTCLFGFSRLEQYDQGGWWPQYVSDTITEQACITVDENGNVVG